MSTPELDLDVARQVLETRIQQQIAFASGIFQGDVTIRTLLESIAEGVVIIDDSGTILLVNTRAELMFGHAKKDLIGKPHSMLIPERFHTMHKKHEANFFAEPRIRPMSQLLDLAALHQDGSEFPVEISLGFIETINGVLVLALVSDMTQRKKAEYARRFSEERYRSLFRDIPTMIVTLNTDWKMLSVNPFCASKLGYAINELEGQSVLKLFHEDDRASMEEQLRTCLRNPDQAYRWQFRKIRKDGGLLWVEETAQAKNDLNGEPYVLIVCQDISERKRAEDEIERLGTRLALRAVDLEDTNRELEAFNYTVAHDLRQPLNVISGYYQAIEMEFGGQLSEECRGYIHECYASTLRMNRLIEDLLNFSRMGHVEPHREMVDLSELMQEAATMLKLTEPDRQIDLRIPAGVVANGDANLLRVVLDNLIGNAWKYTCSQEKTIIEFGVKEISGVPTYFVRDNGDGFDNANADKLFVPFQRLPGAETCRGSGIGLATVERIIRRHGGRIWAEGEPGKGSTFWFTIS